MDKNIFTKIANHSLPKWNDLPELDLYMDQVIALMEKYLADISTPDSKLITPSMINNYVKLGILPAPQKKKYSREHLAYLIIICSLKQVMPISNIKAMIDEELSSNTIAEILDFYSNLYDATFHIILETCSNHLKSDTQNLSEIESTSLFTALVATNCINLSNKIFYMNNPQKPKKSKKSKIKEKEQ